MKPADEFYRDKTKTDGLHSYCKECQKQTSKNWRRDHPDWVTANNKKWLRENPERKREYDRNYYLLKPEVKFEAAERRRARLLNAPCIPFSREQLAQKWAYWGNKCWMCGEEATCTDHVKPLSKGGSHMLCNLRPACRSCNCSKNDKWPYVPPAKRAENSG